MQYQSFLIKYAEIGTKGKNRYMFEDALIKQIRYALKSVEGQAATPEPRKPAKQEPRQSQEENWINQNDTWI